MEKRNNQVHENKYTKTRNSKLNISGVQFPEHGEIFQTTECKIIAYFRLVGGTLIVCDAGHRNIDVIKDVESIHSNLVFTIQKEGNNKINSPVPTRQ